MTELINLTTYNDMKRSHLILIFATMTSLCAATAAAQEALERIHIGVKGAWHGTTARYSNLGPTIPDPSMLSSGDFGLFAEFETGQKGFFSIRPELMFLRRGSKINGIPFSSASQSADYLLNAKYTDLRVPLILNFGKRSGIRPYIFIAPVLGFVRGGTIEMNGLFSPEGIPVPRSIDVGKSNIASMLFAGDFGVGVKFPIHIGCTDMHLGVEFSYEYGFTDTYSPKEKNGEVCCGCALMPGYNISDVSGTRRFTAFDVGLTASVPLSVFTCKRKSPKPRPEAKRKEKEVVVPVKKRKSCYTLEEIVEFINRGESVKGKSICAIDLINFEHGKSTLTADSRTYLNKIATLLKNTGMSVEVKGHTDSTGSDDVNMRLSKRRAEAVYQYLVQRGVKRANLSYSYYGETQPIATNDTEEGRRTNRRVEFEFK